MRYHLILLLFKITLIKGAKIVIIGAGAAGISAATRLIENNITDFIILEAEKRIGGRIHSIYLLNDTNQGGFVDLGGEYVGGEVDNSVYQFSKNYLKFINLSKKTKTFFSSGEKIEDELAQEIYEFKENLRILYENSEPISAKNAFLQGFNSTILSKYENTPYYRQVLGFIDSCEHMFLYNHGAFQWSDILLNNHHKVCKGQISIWNGKGYSFFLDLMMRKFGDQHRLNLYQIYYSTKVKKIIWHKNEIEVLTTDNRTYNCEHVIFTPSAGVLKADHKYLFEPALPMYKIKAIENIGFDSAMKVILKFSQKWWDDEISNFSFIWDQEEVENLGKNIIKIDGKNWLASFHRLFEVEGMPNVLIAWFTGSLVPKIENLPKDELKNGINIVMKTFLGAHYKVTEPDLLIPSSWHSNSNFRGVYSYEKMISGNLKRQVQEDLADFLLNEKNVPVIFFAGEHTSKKHFSSVHGAVESGFRASEELIKYLKDK